ncbi:hypothetical protein FHR24_000018 [Wenyingzhuangia heitensis]|uniref:Uncharacterized protein n=1 Tax=Wenyingzhuangia heitensis TaxID=1487859 RepID=A0ABX0U3Z0_9FLAO|nr:hypothetical protein [Wenyingzhuangia heitensis]NIJ43579.1 hypothetical protein [Wenyingzhuangia heitensis]
MKKFILIAVLLLVGTSYGQNYSSLGLSYGALNGIDATLLEPSSPQVGVDYTSVAKATKGQVYNYQGSIYTYESLSGLKDIDTDAEFVKKKTKTKAEVYAAAMRKDSDASRGNIVIRKAKTEVLVRYNGDYSSIKLIDFKGNEVKANFSKKYRGLIVPRAKKEVKYFLEVKDDTKAKTYYHQVAL